MKKTIVAIISFLILILVMTIIVMCFKTETIIKKEDKIQIVATLFPQYDFAKQIVGDKADVKLLLSSGVEAHNYEPTAKDMITILNTSDVFLYNGTRLEPWTNNIVENLKNYDCKIVNVSASIGAAYSMTEKATYKELYELADATVYEAKIEGKGQFIVKRFF